MQATPFDMERNFVLPAHVNPHLHTQAGSTMIERGDGVYVIDRDGRRYIEAMSGLWNAALGFSETRLADAAYAQMKVLPYYHTFFYRANQPSAELAARLVEMAPGNMRKVHFTSSGSEANDLVLKMMWYRSNALGLPERKKVLTREKGYHGVTIATAALTGITRYHEGFDIGNDRVLRLSCPSYFHFKKDGESESEFTARLVKELEDRIIAEGPETIAAFWGEIIMGGGGVLIPPEAYWPAVQKVLKSYGILLVIDEVITGFGRTGSMFACEKFGVVPDVLVLSKQLTSSYVSMAAIVMSDEFYRDIADGADNIGSFVHGGTTSGHPVAAAVALENLRILEEDGIIANVTERSKRFSKRLHDLNRHAKVVNTRSSGLIGALELRPDGSVGDVGKRMCDVLVSLGVITRNVGDSICFCPPLIITDAQIDEIFDAVEAALERI